MKTLHLIRHAKSSWAQPQLDDEKRPLKGRGRRDVARMAPALDAAGWGGGAIACSTARRARQTLKGLRRCLTASTVEPFYDEALYTFDPQTLLAWLRVRTEDELTIVGHNPALQGLVGELTGRALDRLPTCAYCQLAVAVEDWADCGPGCAELRVFLTPRMLKEAQARPERG